MKYTVEILMSNGIFEDRTETEIISVKDEVELHKTLIGKKLISICSVSEIKGDELNALLKSSKEKFDEDFKLKRIQSIDEQIKQLEEMKEKIKGTIS